MEPPRVVAGRYELRERLGSGGMGEVFLAQDLMIDRQVAIKLLAPDINQKRFLREARATGRLTHANIVTIYDIGTEDGRPFIAMEYVHGEPLDLVIRERRAIPLTVRLQLLEQLCDGLIAAHKQGVVHLDIKPSNLMLTSEMRIKIVDFGIATVAGSGLTATDSIAGSLPYMAPEQLAGDMTDARTDLFSATVVAYELLSYERAYPGGADKAAQRVVDTSVLPLSQLVSVLGASADALIQWGLNRNPSERPQTAEQLKGRLSALRGRLATETLPPTERLGSGSPTPISRGFLGTTDIDSTEIETVEVGLSPAKGRLIAAAAVLTVGVAGAMWLNSGSSTGPPTSPGVGNDGPASISPTPPAPTKSPVAKGNPPRGRISGPADTGPGRSGAGTEKPAGSSEGDPSAPLSNTGAVPQTVPQTDQSQAAASATFEATPTPTPVSTPMSTPGPPPAPPGPGVSAPPIASAPSDDDLIRKVLADFSAAHRERSTIALVALYPSLSRPELAALDKTFISSSEYRLDLTDIKILVQGSQAKVSCRVSRRFVPLTGEPRNLVGPGVFELRREARGWIITHAKIP